MSTVYAVWFEDKGYYAKHQPTYEWCFTKNAEEANLYKSIGGAYERGEDGDDLGYGRYEIHEFVSSLEFVGVRESQDMRAMRRAEAEEKHRKACEADKDPNVFTTHRIVADRIRRILHASFGDNWRSDPEAKAALLQSDGFDPEAVLLVMKEVL